MNLRALVRWCVGAACVVQGLCHGYLAQPAARNVQHATDYCRHCLNGPEICGDPRGQHHHEASGKFASPVKIAQRYRAGGVLKARVVITANHMGRWGLRLCALKDASPGAERATLKNCLKPLRLSGGKGRYVYVPSTASESHGSFRLPRGMSCKRCVVQWRWETSNTCNPPGTPHKYRNPYVGTCTAGLRPETFTNCADISIIGR